MAASTNKKVLVARFDKAPLEGFLQLPEGTQAASLELLTTEGTVQPVPIEEVRLVAFVRDFPAEETWKQHRSFLSRPKSNGLWLRLRFRDGESIEGLIPNDLLQVDLGFTIVPPDPTFQNHRIFVPRQALQTVQVLGVIGSPLKRKKPVAEETQLKMFE